jgi:hypothetical protein
MSVYVDDVAIPFGKMLMCHMWADSLDELIAMAHKLELRIQWIQGHPTLSAPAYRKASWVHFDISKGKKTLAIQYGAILTDKYGPLEFEARKTGNHAKLEQIAELRKFDSSKNHNNTTAA